MELFSQGWADAAKDAINAFPDDDYRATKLQMYWDWIEAAKGSFAGSLALGVRGGGRYAIFEFGDGACTSATIADAAPDATFVLSGDAGAWRDILGGYDAGKAVMYRRLRLEQGDVFRFFNRIYLFTESLVALQKIPATLPA